MSAQCKVRLCICAQVLLLFATCGVRGFNVDTESFVKHSGDPGSMFGFSVAEHKERGSNWLLVGAPEAQTPQPGVKRGGAVYRCDITRDDYCQQIPFDQTGNNNNSDNVQLDSKSYQWFGATVRSSGENGVIVACAPRYVYYSTHLSRRDPVGTCYVAKNQMSDFSEFSPCRTRNWGYHRQGSCQAGLGASISKDGKRLFIGAPGSWYWQGQVISQNLYSRPEVIDSKQGPATDDDSYLGYSVAAGDFSGGGGQNDVAVGMPRGAGLLGKIVLYSWNITNLQNITGEQLGAYFGYSLAAVDMDGDRLDDLVIGAPLYTDLSNNEGDYETGRVYVVYQGRGSQKFRSMNTRDGVNSKSRFGLALASLGDINKDGYGDVAIGAPYDGPQERGAVYIYHGSEAGIREKPSQVIRTSDLGLPLTTFGFSLSGGVDMDENQYPDLIVGAYESDTAVFLKARPVVKMMSSVAFLSDQKQVILEETNCTLKDGTRVACLSLKMCLEYSGLGVDPRLDFDVQLLLDSKKPKSPRMSFLSAEGQSLQNQTLTLDKGLQRCQEVFVYIKQGIRDKLTALEAEMRYSLHGEEQGGYTRRRYQRALTPVLDLNEPLSRKDTVTIQKNCGKDNICIPNLRINATPNVKRYLLGSGERLFVDVVVINEGEDAFESVFDMKVPPGINYVNIERLDTERDVFVQCSAPSFINNYTLHCDIGNPLPKEKTVHFKVLLQPFHKPGMKARYEFDIAVNSTNPENVTSSADNLQQLVVPIWVETDLILQGSSHPSTVHYNTSLYSEEDITQETDIGPQVVHIYSIRNKGPSDIVEADVHFLWPTATLSHDNLLYLLEQPELNGPIKCELAPNVNPLNLKLEKKKKSYLELSGVQSSLTSSTSYSSSSQSSSGGVTIEESSSSSSSRSSSSSSSSSISGNKGVIKSTSYLTEEERRRLEEAEKRDREEAAAETGDGSQRHNKRIYPSSATESGGRVETSSNEGRISTSYNEGSYRGQGYESVSGSTGAGVRVESGSYGGRGSSGVVVSERGKTDSGAGFEIYNTFDSDRRTGGESWSSQGGRAGGSNNGYGVEENINRRRYGSDERLYGRGQDGGYSSYPDSQSASQNRGGSRKVTDTVTRRNQTDYYGVDRVGSIPNSIGGVKNHSFSTEEEHSTNTTWNSGSGGKPITHTSTRWRENKDGNVREGGSTNTYEERGTGYPANNEGVRNHTFSREEEHSSNTTWNSESGRQPITHTSTSWRETEDGNVRRGSSSNSYEATNVNIGDMMTGGNYGSGRTNSEDNRGSYNSGSSVTRQHVSETERRHGSGTEVRGSGSQSSRSDYDRRQDNYGSGSGSSHTYNVNTGSSSGYDSRTNDPNAVLAPSNSYGQDARRVYNANEYSGSSNYDSRRVNGAGAASGSSQFDALAGIAQGPRDGNARTYSFDVLNENNQRSGVANSGSSQYASVGGVAAGSHGVASRTHSYGVDGSRQQGGYTGSSVANTGSSGSQYSNSSSSSHRNSWSTSSDGGKHFVSGAWNSEEGDEADYDPKRGRDNVGYDRSGGGGTSWRASSTWETRNAGGYYEGNPDVSSRRARINNYEAVTAENLIDEEPGLRQRYKSYSRNRRQLSQEEDDALENIDCGPIECTRIRCTVGPLSKDQEAWIAFRSRVWVQTLKKFAFHPEVQVSSLMAGRVTQLPHIGPPDQSAIHTHEVVTQVVPRDTGTKPDVVPLWVVVLSACAGALILMLLVYLLYKCGFFKRNRPSSDVPEKQPLNRNGHYQSGDEAL